LMKNLRSWSGVTWFVEGDIYRLFENLDHGILMNIIGRIIKDQQVLDLIWKFLRAGVLIDKVWYKTTIGILQVGIISPILSNIYLNKFDNYMEKIINEETKKQTSLLNSEYIKKKLLFRSYKNEIRKKKYVELQDIKFTIRKVVKIYYNRYANSWLIGVFGNRQVAINFKLKVREFLKKELNLELSSTKTKIIHAGTRKAEFLEFNVSSLILKKLFYAKDKIKKWISHVRIVIEAPYNRLKNKLVVKGFLTIKDGKWVINSITKWINYNHAEIIYRYNCIIRGLVNYYSCVDNLMVFRKLIEYVLRHSCALTFSRKFKLRSRKKIFRKFGKNLKDPVSGTKLAIPVSLKKNGRKYKNDIKWRDPFKIMD
jgi:hypothetical protein